MSDIEKAEVQAEVERVFEELRASHASGKLVSLVYVAVLANETTPGAPALLCKRGATRGEVASIVGQALIEMACDTFTNKDGELNRVKFAKALTAAVNGADHPGTERVPAGAVH